MENIKKLASLLNASISQSKSILEIQNMLSTNSMIFVLQRRIPNHTIKMFQEMPLAGGGKPEIKKFSHPLTIGVGFFLYAAYAKK